MAAATQLRDLRDVAGPSELSFQAVSDIAEQLSDDGLVKMAQDLGVGRTHSMRGWVRAALLAEWGRRDFRQAMTHLSSVSELDSGHQQSLYAVFRGSRPADAPKALAHLQHMFTEYPSAVGAFSRGWAKRALREVFAEMAARNPQQAWQFLTEKEKNSPERKALVFLSKKFTRLPGQTNDSVWTAMEGFFAGLSSLAEVEAYAPRFNKLWNAPEVVVALKEFHAQRHRNVGSMSWTPPPPLEAVAESVAISIARFDLRAGVDWLVSNGPGTEQQKRRRTGGLFTEWAWVNPGKALALLQNGEHSKWHETIATSLMRGDAGLAPAVVRLFATKNWNGDVLSNAFPAAATMMAYDLYPVPTKDPILPSHQARYDSFREAIRNCPLPEKELRAVNRSLNGAFRYTVPTAEKAYQIVQRN